MYQRSSQWAISVKFHENLSGNPNLAEIEQIMET